MGEGGGLDMTAALAAYEDGMSGKCNDICVELLKEIQSQRPGEKNYIFEIGSGTGGTTSFVLPAMPKHSTRFVFTDLSNAFLVNARVRFQHAFPFVEYTIFNADKDPCEQGFNIYRYHDVVATNVIHATKHLPFTVSVIHRLINDSGHLIFNEVQNSGSMWDDLTYGLTDGWWLYTDYERRQTYPLLRNPQWGELFKLCGFQNVWHTPDDGAYLNQQQIVCARKNCIPKSYEPLTKFEQAEPKGTYFFTGGVGGLGILSALIMMERGAKYLLFVSRRDHVPIEARDQWAKIRDSSCTISRGRCNISEATGVFEHFTNTDAPPVVGVYHAAGILSDGAMSKQTREKYQQTFQPKYFGCTYLHRFSLNGSYGELQQFCTFASSAGFGGSPGQSSHSAANTVMDAMMEFRCAMGLPSTSVSWGAVADIGYAARHAVAGAANSLPFKQAWAVLDTVSSNPSMIVAANPHMWAQGGMQPAGGNFQFYLGTIVRYRNSGKDKGVASKPSTSGPRSSALQKGFTFQDFGLKSEEDTQSGGGETAETGEDIFVFEAMGKIHDEWQEQADYQQLGEQEVL